MKGKNPVTGVSDTRSAHISEALHPVSPATLLAPDGAEQLMSHPWFFGIDWTSLHTKTPPYQPNLATPDDTRHFDEDIPDEVGGVRGGADRQSHWRRPTVRSRSVTRS